MEKRINIFLGNYGSGKTEISLNIANEMASENKKVLLLDMDIVNPYFRSSEHQEAFEKKGVKIIAPTFANTAVDLPTISPLVYQIDEPSYHVVVDCGGDPGGATAMGFLADRLENAKHETDVFFVANTFRPLQSDANGVVEMIESIEYVSKLKVNKLIVNSNLANETDYTHLEHGVKVCEEVCEQKEIDIAFVCGTHKVIDDYKKHNLKSPYKMIIIDIYTKPNWMAK